MRRLLIAMIIVAALALTTSGAMADEIDDAHLLALQARDTYWTCLAGEYSKDSNKAMSGQDFTLHIASVCPSERQYFRVALVGYVSVQFPGADAGAHMTTANNVIALVQQDVVTAFIKRKERRSSSVPADGSASKAMTGIGTAEIATRRPPPHKEPLAAWPWSGA